MTDSTTPAGGAQPGPAAAPAGASAPPTTPEPAPAAATLREYAGEAHARALSGFPPPSEPIPALSDVIARPVKATSGRGSSILLGLAAAIAIGGLAFAAGRFTAPAAATGAASGRFGQGGQGPTYLQNGQGGQGFQGVPGYGTPGDRGLFGGVTLKGEVTAISADSITLKLSSGTSLTIPLSGSTTYHTATSSSASAVAVGSTVTVTPGARTANPGASANPNASPGPGGVGGLSFGAATDVTVTAP